jgi:hypothetical protein
MLFALVSSYQPIFVSPVLGSVFSQWDQVIGCLFWLYCQGHMGFNLCAVCPEMEDWD